MTTASKIPRPGLGFAILLFIALAVVRSVQMQNISCGPTGGQMKAVSNGRQVWIALQQYHGINNAGFPDQLPQTFKSSNEVLRELFKSGVATDERIFASSSKAFVPDTEIGIPPNFEKALMPGECGWMLLKHQAPTSDPRTPILIESAINGSWPPRWDITPPSFEWFGLVDRDPVPPREKGSAWSDRYVVVVYLDGHANLERLTPEGTLDLRPGRDLGDWFESLTPEQRAKLEYWDVEVKAP